MENTQQKQISYRPVVTIRTANVLPFVRGNALTVGACWVVKTSGDAAADFERGEELARHYLAFVRDGNGQALPGGLMQIVSSMAKAGALDRRTAGDSQDPAAVGFLCTIDATLREHLLAA